MTYRLNSLKSPHGSSRVFSAVIATAFVFLSVAVPAINIGSKGDVSYGSGNASPAAYPDTHFAVISDIHYYDTSLGTDGKAFDDCLNSDHKLLKESDNLLDSAISEIKYSGARFVLVPGDLTKDGELSSHIKVASKLEQLKSMGIDVYIIPGNHDINNPRAFGYNGSDAVHVAGITPAQFAKIYGDFGYNKAIMRDSGSLSYVAEPCSGLWLVAIDSCRYAENQKSGEEIVSGRITKSEMRWLEGVLRAANEKGKAVFVMVHHGIVEHWKGQAAAQPDFLLKDYRNIGRLFASYGVRVAFTGHFHAQDIAYEDYGRYGGLYDIETGSLVSVPCPLRLCNISDGRLYVRTDRLIDSMPPKIKSSAYQFEQKAVNDKVRRELAKALVNPADAAYMASYFSECYMAHFAGDESISQKPAFDETRLTLWGRVVFGICNMMLSGIWNDKQPSDNNCVILLK